MPLKRNTYTEYKFDEIADSSENNKEDYPVVIGETFGINKTSIMLHCHDYIEICYIKHGTGTYLIDGNDYSFQTGDIFVIGSNEIHLAYNDKDVIMLVALFKPGLLWNGAGYTFEMEQIQTFWEIRNRLCHKVSPVDQYYSILVDTLMDIFYENSEKMIGYKLVVKSLFIKFTAMLRRNFQIEHNHEFENKERNHDMLLPVIEYIKSNYYKKIKLEDMASILNIGVSTFSLVFKKSMGTTPIEYINKIRIMRASQMLLETEDKIIDIAAECGFMSLPHFISSFKKYTGKLPKDFRSIREYIN